MNDDPMDEIKAFVKERDAMLLSMDLERLQAFYQKHNQGTPRMSPEAAEIALHKARSAATSLPDDARTFSENWLKERGYSSLRG
jgi:hypothetical protein